MPFDFDAVAAPFRMQPGLRRIAPGARRLSPTCPGSRHLGEKVAALAHHALHALLCRPGFDPMPALAALMRQATTEHPACFSWDGHLRLEARALGWSVSGASVEGDGAPDIGDLLRRLPGEWRLPALLGLACVQDFAVIDGADATIPWLAVCLPSRWAPETKLGLHFAQVHAPVADNALLVAAGDHLARLVTAEQRWERFVWSVTGDPGLMQHPAHAPAPAWPGGLEGDALAERTSFRTEHQTFIPVPGVRQAVFTIEVDSRPLADAIDSAERARRLHAALASMGSDVLAYRGLATARAPLLAWLARRAG